MIGIPDTRHGVRFCGRVKNGRSVPCCSVLFLSLRFNRKTYERYCCQNFGQMPLVSAPTLASGIGENKGSTNIAVFDDKTLLHLALSRLVESESVPELAVRLSQGFAITFDYVNVYSGDARRRDATRTRQPVFSGAQGALTSEDASHTGRRFTPWTHSCDN